MNSALETLEHAYSILTREIEDARDFLVRINSEQETASPAKIANIQARLERDLVAEAQHRAAIVHTQIETAWTPPDNLAQRIEEADRRVAELRAGRQE